MRRLGLLWLFSFSALAQQHPDFTGTWRLSVDESDFAGQKAPQSRTDTVIQKDDRMDVTVRETDGNRERTGHFVYKLDGSVTKNVIEGSPVECTAKWDVSDLVIHSMTHTPQGENTLEDRWALSLDTRRLVIRRHFAGHGIQDDQSLVEYRESRQ